MAHNFDKTKSSLRNFFKHYSDESAPEIEKVSSSQQPFSKLNFLLIAGCVVLIIIGFLLMSGSGSSVENGFNPDIFSTRRIIIGPAISFLGFLFLAFAIIWSPKKKNS